MAKGVILYVGGFELPDKNAAAHRVLSNAKILRDIGYKVVFVDIDKSLSYDKKFLATNKNVQGFDCWSVPYPNIAIEWISYLSSIDYINLIKKQYKNIEGIIAYNYPALALNNLRKYGKKNNVRVFADCTEWYSTKGSNLVFKVIKGLDSSLRMRIIQKRLDGLIVISKLLEQYYSKCNNVVRIPPLIDLDENKWNLEEGENKCNMREIVLTYSGSPGREKDDIPLLLEILYEMNDNYYYRLDIIGISEEQYISNFPEHKKLIHDMNDRIRFIGRVTHLESLEVLKESDFSIFIRRQSKLTNAGFPTKFVESITCGIPVITTKTSDLGDYLFEGENGFFIDIKDSEATTEMFAKILSMNKKEIQQIKNNLVMRDRFHYKNYINDMKKILGG